MARQVRATAHRIKYGSQLMLWLSIQLRVTFCRITAVVKSNEVEISAVLALFNAEISSLFDFNENWHEHFPN